MVRKYFLVSLLIAVLIIAGFSTGAIGAAKSPYVIGAIFSTTGDNAPLGVPQRNTIEMLVKQINAKGGIKGHQVKVEFYDDEGKPERAVQACQELLSNKDVVAIIGPTLSGPSLAIAQMCQDKGMPLISCAASVKIVSPVRSYIFKTAQSDSLAVARIIGYLKEKKIKTVCFINDSNAFGSSGRDQWTKLSEGTGITTVDTESFGSNDTDMTAQLTKIRAAKPQAIICWGTNPGPAMVANDVKKLGMNQLLVMSHGIANMEFINLAKSAANGVIFPAGKMLVAKAIDSNDPQKKVIAKYVADYEKTYKKSSNTFGGHAWDSFMLVANALDKVGSDKAKIRDFVEKTKRFAGISGVFNFRPNEHNGLNHTAFALVIIKNGKWELVK